MVEQVDGVNTSWRRVGSRCFESDFMGFRGKPYRIAVTLHGVDFKYSAFKPVASDSRYHDVGYELLDVCDSPAIARQLCYDACLMTEARAA